MPSYINICKLDLLIQVNVVDRKAELSSASPTNLAKLQLIQLSVLSDTAIYVGCMQGHTLPWDVHTSSQCNLWSVSQAIVPSNSSKLLSIRNKWLSINGYPVHLLRPYLGEYMGWRRRNQSLMVRCAWETYSERYFACWFLWYDIVADLLFSIQSSSVLLWQTVFECFLDNVCKYMLADSQAASEISLADLFVCLSHD